MDEDLRNNDVDMNPDEDADSPTEGDSTSEDNSTQNHLQEWVINTDTNIGTPGEIPPTPTPPSEPEKIIQVDIPIKRRWTITNYDLTYLRQLYEKGGVFYVVYEDGTEDECEYTDVVNPFSIAQSKIVMEVDEITQANNQHFWYDDNGAHVTDETRYSWEENASLNFSDLSDNNNHNNLLMNSYGLVIRRALKNLAAFSKSAVTFYDGDGNEASNMLAMFGKNGVQMGSINSNRISINPSGIFSYNTDNICYFGINLKGPIEEVPYAHNRQNLKYNTDSNIIINLDECDWGPIRSVYKPIAKWPPLDDSKIRITGILPSLEGDNFTLQYGTETDGFVAWSYGTYKYDGENKLEINFTVDASYVAITMILSKTMMLPMFTLGDGVSENAYALAEGHNTSASGKASHAEGDSSEASGEASHAEGYSQAKGMYSHAEGRSQTIGYGSHAEGDSQAQGELSHAEGRSKANGTGSHAEGDSQAEGMYSHAEGSGIAVGNYSHAQNEGTVARGDCQTVLGKYNYENDELALIIGNGSENNRSNCFTIDWNGLIDFGPQAISRNTNATLVMKNRSSQMDYGGLYICDKNTNVSNYVVRQHVRETANNGVRWYRTEISRTVNNNRAYNAISIGLDNTNKAVYGVSNPAAFRDAINAVDANRLKIIEYADPRFVIYGTSGTAIEFIYNPTSKNLAVRGYNGTSWTSYKTIINLA